MRIGRFRFGIPPKTKGDLAFVQHMVATAQQARSAWRRHAARRAVPERNRRRDSEGTPQEDLIEAVIGLPPNLFYGTGIPAAVLVMGHAKSSERRGKVLFIDASRDFEQAPLQNRLRDVDVKKVAVTFHAPKDVARYARVVTVEEIKRHEFNLNIGRYIDAAEPAALVDVTEALKRLRQLEAERAAAETRMNSFLKELGFGA